MTFVNRAYLNALSCFPKLALAATLTLTGFVAVPDIQAQGPPPRSQRESAGLPQISIIDKLLAAEMAMARALGSYDEAAWIIRYKEMYKTFHEDISPAIVDSKERPRLALALGVRASDGVVALKAHDIESLNRCAEDIEKLAKRLDVEDKYLTKVNLVKHHADRGQWPQAFMSLGFLQHEVMRALKEHPDRKPDAVVVVIGSWLQGGRTITDFLIKNHGTTEGGVPISNILREPTLLGMMINEVEALPANIKQHPAMVEVIKFLPVVRGKVNIGRTDPVPKADVEWMHSEFTRLVKMVVARAAP